MTSTSGPDLAHGRVYRLGITQSYRAFSLTSSASAFYWTAHTTMQGDVLFCGFSPTATPAHPADSIVGGRVLHHGD